MREINEARVLEVLSRHIGRDNSVHGRQLTGEIFSDASAAVDSSDERKVRKAIEMLRDKGCHVCGNPRDGYFMAATPEELLETLEFLHGRAVSSLKKVAAMQGVSMPDLRGQLHLPT